MSTKSTLQPTSPSGPVQDRTHDLKSWVIFFAEVWKGDKRHEVRRDDRRFELGDTITLREFLPDLGQYTGRWVRAVITSITRPGPVGGNARLPEGLAVFTFAEIGRGGDDL